MELIRVEQGRGWESRIVPFSQIGVGGSGRVRSRMVRPGVEERRMRTGRKKGVRGGGGGLREGWRRHREGGRGFCSSGQSAAPTGVLSGAVHPPWYPKRHSKPWLSSFNQALAQKSHQGPQKGLSPCG